MEKVLTAGGFSGILSLATKTSDYSMTTEDVILADGASNNVVVTLPDASTLTGKGRWVKRIDASAYSVTVESAGGTIDGETSIPLYSQYAYVAILSDGTNWHIIATSLALG